MFKRYALWSYVAGAAAARTGDDMSGPALLLAGLAVTGSAALASSLLAGMMISAALGGPLLGVLLDRSARPGLLLAGALALYASALAVILISLGHLPVPVIFLIAVGAGLLGPALSGGWTSQLPRVTPGEALPRATALDAMTFNVASLAGPALAGIIVGLAGASAGMIASIALICLAVPSARALPARRPAPASPGEHPGSASPHERPRLASPGEQGSAPPGTRAVAARPRSSIRAELAAGFRAIFRTLPLARATVTSVISCAGQGFLLACSPLLGDDGFGSPSHGAILLAVVAASAFAANALLARAPRLIRPDTIMLISTLLLAAALLLAAPGQPVLVISAMVIAGAGEGPQLTALFAIRHREAPRHLRGQIFTTGASLKITAFALGTGVAGPVAAWSLPAALLTAATVQVLAALSFFALAPRPLTGAAPHPEAGDDRSVERNPCYSSDLFPHSRSRIVRGSSRSRRGGHPISRSCGDGWAATGSQLRMCSLRGDTARPAAENGELTPTRLLRSVCQPRLGPRSTLTTDSQLIATAMTPVRAS